MKVAARFPGYIIKVSTKEFDNDGYQFAVFTKEEAAMGALGEPEWQCDTFVEALDFVADLEARRYKSISAVPEYREEVEAWLRGLSI